MRLSRCGRLDCLRKKKHSTQYVVSLAVLGCIILLENVVSAWHGYFLKLEGRSVERIPSPPTLTF